MKFDKRDLECMAALQSDPRFKHFMGILRRQEEELIEQIYTGYDTNSVMSAKGAARQVHHILRSVETSREQLEKF